MESRKNKDENPEMSKSEEDEEREEVKMEMFFSLLKSFREARDRRRTELNDSQINEQKDEDDNGSSNRKKIKKIHDDPQTSWIPSFEWEDFTKEVEFRGPRMVSSSPILDPKKKSKDDGVDLNHTL